MRIVRQYWGIIALLLVFIFALLLRIYKLHTLPLNLHEDEILSGYIGRFILKNGIDVYGNKWPLLYFNKFGDYYIVLPFYLSGLGVTLFGPNGLGVRFFGALLGGITVFPVYLIAKKLFKSTTVGLVSALVLAIMPWHVVLSRTTVEGLMGTAIFSFGIVSLFFAEKQRRSLYLLSAFVLFLISYFFYHPFRVYVPLTCLVFCLIYFDKKNIKSTIVPGLMTIFFIVLTLYIGRTPWGSGRFVQTSIFSPLSGVSIRIHEQIFNEPSIFWARVFNNKPLFYGREFLYQYSRYFSPDVLFVRGGNSPRFFTPEQGLVYLIFLPVLLYGLLQLIKKGKQYDKRGIFVLLFLLFLAPLPAGLTIIDSPNIHRAVFMTVPLSILIGFGLYQVLIIKKYFRLIPLITLLILLGEFVFFIHQYSVQSDLATSLVRNDGQKKIVEYIKQNRDQYKRVYLPVDGTFPLYYLFYTNNFNKELAKNIKFNIRLKNVDNIFFIDNNCPSATNIDIGVGKVLVIDRHNCLTPNGLRQIDSIAGVNPLTPFRIYSN